MPQIITFVPKQPAASPANIVLTPRFTQPLPLALYVHIPWCVRKCPYCDFNSHAAPQVLPEAALVEALLNDLTQALPEIWGRRVDSIFFGGGTPSLLSPAAIDQLLNGFRALLPLAPDAEITLEANPGTVDAERFAGFKAAGVNRLSLGIQSFDDAALHTLGRIHDRAQAVKAIEAAARIFDTFNLDLMVGLPDDDTCADIQDALEARLNAAGYAHYETSAFAQPGHACRHNRNYWTFGDYLGIGPGAHSKLTNHAGAYRTMRHKLPKAYLAANADGDFIQTREAISGAAISGEFMMNALRLNDGFSVDLFERHTGLPWLVVSRAVDEAVDAGLLEWPTPQTLRPTLRGRRFLNVLLQQFL